MQFIWAAAGTDKCCVIAGARGMQRIKAKPEIVVVLHTSMLERSGHARV